MRMPNDDGQVTGAVRFEARNNGDARYITFRITEALAQRVRLETARRNCSIQKLMTDLIEEAIPHDLKVVEDRGAKRA